MPTYDYACQECGHTFETFQSMSDALLKKCPQCRKPRLKRLLGTGAGLIFKGTGFYITDYKNKPPGAGKKEGGGEGKSGESKSSETKGGDKKTSSDSKPASDSKSSTRPSSPKE